MFFNRLRLLLLFVFLSTVLWLGFGYYRSWRRDEGFVKNIRCGELAGTFAKSNADATGHVIRAIYSSKKNSCLAAIEYQNLERYWVSVIDPATRESVYLDSCYWRDKECATSTSSMLGQSINVLSRWADKPLANPASVLPRTP